MNIIDSNKQNDEYVKSISTEFYDCGGAML
jgi:hypothetical protein